jgi:hypothetical protein
MPTLRSLGILAACLVIIGIVPAIVLECCEEADISSIDFSAQRITHDDGAELTSARPLMLGSRNDVKNHDEPASGDHGVINIGGAMDADNTPQLFDETGSVTNIGQNMNADDPPSGIHREDEEPRNIGPIMDADNPDFNNSTEPAEVVIIGPNINVEEYLQGFYDSDSEPRNIGPDMRVEGMHLN